MIGRRVAATQRKLLVVLINVYSTRIEFHLATTPACIESENVSQRQRVFKLSSAMSYHFGYGTIKQHITYATAPL